jgi:hypothetical protein
MHGLRESENVLLDIALHRNRANQFRFKRDTRANDEGLTVWAATPGAAVPSRTGVYDRQSGHTVVLQIKQ